MLKPDAARTIWLDLVRSTLPGFRGVGAAAIQQEVVWRIGGDMWCD
jgi:hypothetical protein